MKKHLLCIAVLLLLFPVSTAEVEQIPVPVYTGVSNIFARAFTQPFEVAYFICYDGTAIQITNQLDGMVICPIDILEGMLRSQGKTLEDVAIIMHNHFKRTDFSIPDKRFLANLRERGFKGAFGVYATATKQIRIDREN